MCSTRLPVPSLFTPATKADMGEHDENVSYQAVARQIGDRTASTVRRATKAGLATIARKRNPNRSRWGNPGVSTNPGKTPSTAIPRGASSAAIERENASWACFDAEYGPPATAPATA